MVNKRETLAFVEIKAKNRRTLVRLIQDDTAKAFAVDTKRLVDFKKREIVTTSNVFSIETSYLLVESFTKLLNSAEIADFLKEERNNLGEPFMHLNIDKEKL